MDWAGCVRGAERWEGGSDVGGGRREAASDWIILCFSEVELGGMAFGRLSVGWYDPTIARDESMYFSSGGRRRIGGERCEADVEAVALASRGAALPIAFSCMLGVL